MTVRAEILTSQGTSNVGGAIGVIQLSGPAGAALDQVRRLVRGKQLEKIATLECNSLGEGANICLVNLYDPRAGGEGGGELIDQTLVVATSKTKIELHLHGGLAVLRRIMKVLGELGVRCENDSALIENSREELSAEIEAEVLAALPAALTQTAVQMLAAQLGGAGLLSWGLGWITRLHTPQDVLRCQNEIQWVLDRTTVLQRLLVVPRVVLAGQPNVGKSTLMNALLGRAVSITSAQAGTTRDWVDAPVLLSTGVGPKQVEVAVTLIDTAGVRTSADAIEELAVERSWEQIKQADLVLAIMDVSTLNDQYDQDWLAALTRTCDTHGITLLQVNNKSDLRGQTQIPRPASNHPVISVSALQQQGLESLVAAMLAGLGVRDLPVDSSGGGGGGEPWAFTPRQQDLLRRAGLSQTTTEVVTLLDELCSGTIK